MFLLKHSAFLPSFYNLDIVEDMEATPGANGNEQPPFHILMKEEIVRNFLTSYSLFVLTFMINDDDIDSRMTSAWNDLFIGLLLIPIIETPIFKYRDRRGGIIKFIVISILSAGCYFAAGALVITFCGMIASHVIRIILMIAVSFLLMIIVLYFEPSFKARGWDNVLFVLWCIVALIASYYINIAYS